MLGSDHVRSMARGGGRVNPTPASAVAFGLAVSGLAQARGAAHLFGGHDVIGMGGTAGGRPDRAEVDQFAFQALDVEPERPATAEHQDRAAAGGFTGMKLDPEQLKGCFRRLQIDIARLA